MQADPHNLFWRSNTKAERLLSQIRLYIGLAKCDEENFAAEVLVCDSAGYRLPNALGVARLASGDTKRRQEREEMSGLLCAFCELLKGFLGLDLDDAASSQFADAFALRDELQKHLARHTGSIVPREAKAPAIQSPALYEEVVPKTKEIEVFYTLLSRFMNIDQDDLDNAYRSFFSEEEIEKDGKKIHYKWFNCYRPYSQKGFIAKSFLVIKVVIYDSRRVCYFSNFFPMSEEKGILTREDEIRVTRGILLPTQRVLYLVGEMAQGNGLKVVAIDKPPLPRAVYHGIVTTFEQDQSAIASRIVIKKSKAEHHKDAGIGVLSEKELAGELGESLMRLKPAPGNPAVLRMWHAHEG